MDQSCQVDFPIVMKKMRRHNTSADLYVQHNRSSPVSSWRHLKPVMARPRSLNVTSFNDVCKQTTKVVYCSDAGAPNGSPLNRLSSPISEMHNNNNKGSFVFRERTPPFSSDSSINSTANMTYKSSCKVKQDDSCCCSTKCWQCSDEQLSCRKCPQNASQNLSWKRLHMSRAKLKATATTSELLSGFAMIAMVELQINEPTNVPEWLFVMFAVCTTILVAVHIFALMISTYILPNIDAIAKLEVCEMVSESPHERMRWFIELAWAFSTVLGLFLFLVEVAILCWVKFWDYSSTAATAATIIVIPVLVIFILFAVHFYHSLVVYKCNSTLSDIEKLEDMKKQLDQVTKTV